MSKLSEDRKLLEDMQAQIDAELFREKYGITEEQANELIKYLATNPYREEIDFPFSSSGDFIRRGVSISTELERMNSRLRAYDSDLVDIEMSMDKQPKKLDWTPYLIGGTATALLISTLALFI